MLKDQILLVEDEPDLLQTLSFNFENEGYKVSKASNGEKALKLLEKNNSIALVVLDLMLPDISGLDICRHIRSSDNLKDILVIMVTAKGEEVDRVVGFEIGADDYVVKPYSVRELMLRVGGLLKRSSKERDESNDEVRIYKDLKIKQNDLRIKIQDLEHKNSLLTENIDLDFIEILIRDKFLFGKEGETTYIIEQYGKN